MIPTDKEFQAVEAINEAANEEQWWTRQLGDLAGKACFEAHNKRDVQALYWVRELVNETLTGATWSELDE